ncbi:uncharacterized protein [Lepisosteus oculatus]|uniref:uncharacterized protein n=1 Tax=Lepisosteus oculatus TaxID=7918 RepID=UPI0037202F58
MPRSNKTVWKLVCVGLMVLFLLVIICIIVAIYKTKENSSWEEEKKDLEKVLEEGRQNQTKLENDVTEKLKQLQQCEETLKNETQKHLQEKSSWEKDRKTLKELLEKGRVNQTRLQRDLAMSQGQLKQSNESLMACLRDMKLLNGTKTFLQRKIDEEQKKCANDKKHLEDTLTSDFQQKLQEEKKKYKQECEKQKKELGSQGESLNGASGGHKPEYCCFIYALGVAVLMTPLLF